MTRGLSTSLPTALPARFRPRFAWRLDRRSKAVREVAADLIALWQDLGGFEVLSTQQLMLTERIVFMHRRVIEFESAVMAGTAPPFEYGTYTNLANTLIGHLRTLGLERKARTVKTLRQVMDAA